MLPTSVLFTKCFLDMLLIFRFDIYLRLFLIIVKQKNVRLKIYLLLFTMPYPENKYLLEIKNTNTRKRCKICSELIIKTPKWRHWQRSGLLVVKFEHTSHLFLLFLLLTVNKYVSWMVIVRSYHNIFLSFWALQSDKKNM